ncbi:adenine phosphoribosyltransferase [Gammaproteobacteria bacterium]|nr:adenine phosphoribosyltransferase [Gammaproteobacteria bacterium]
MSIKSKIRTVPNYPLEGIMFRDISTLLADSEGLQELAGKLFEELKGLENEIDYIIGIESRGFTIGSILAYVLKKGFVMIRKPGKLPVKTIRIEYELEYGSDALEIAFDAFPPKSKILLVDDLLATGGTAIAAINLIEKIEGVILGTAFIVNLPDLGGSNKIKNLGYSVISLAEFEGD